MQLKNNKNKKEQKLTNTTKKKTALRKPNKIDITPKICITATKKTNQKKGKPKMKNVSSRRGCGHAKIKFKKIK